MDILESCFGVKELVEHIDTHSDILRENGVCTYVDQLGAIQEHMGHRAMCENTITSA